MRESTFHDEAGVATGAKTEKTRESSPIMSYSAKYASAFYGPFRDAATLLITYHALDAARWLREES